MKTELDILATHIKSHPIPSHSIPSHPIPFVIIPPQSQIPSHSQIPFPSHSQIPNPKSHSKSHPKSHLNPVVVEGQKYHHSNRLIETSRMVVFPFFHDHWMSR